MQRKTSIFKPSDKLSHRLQSWHIQKLKVHCLHTNTQTNITFHQQNTQINSSLTFTDHFSKASAQKHNKWLFKLDEDSTVRPQHAHNVTHACAALTNALGHISQANNAWNRACVAASVCVWLISSSLPDFNYRENDTTSTTSQHRHTTIHKMTENRHTSA